MTRIFYSIGASLILAVLSGAIPSAPGACSERLDGPDLLRRAHNLVGGTNLSATFVVEVTTPTLNAHRAGRIYRDHDHDAVRTLLILDAPDRARGTKVLSVRTLAGPEQRWMYRPSRQQVRRQTPSGLGASVFGADADFHTVEFPLPANTTGASIVECDGDMDSGAYRVDFSADEYDGVYYDRLWIRDRDFVPMRREVYLEGRLQRVYTGEQVETVAGTTTITAMSCDTLGTIGH